ncbi:hypothetical protein EVJ50_05945 [Synechococcus sp. RSCCF101]|uniref:hypothetical protein n=1 Tax=Synechococcus sp. RSCCF101 TaxID=2511069 RepID=UPI001243BC49|nr:hypothetical protein [Synechococcus sp. RSCCF101]QEY31852.1 hypothetical protein EVJ50_05945 [Synechococcus sp. RSCCF101]
MVPGDIARVRLGEGHTRPVRRCLDGKQARIISMEGDLLKVSLLHDASRTFSVRSSEVEALESPVELSSERHAEPIAP